MAFIIKPYRGVLKELFSRVFSGDYLSKKLIDLMIKGDFVSARKILGSVTDVNFQDEVNGYTPLMLASQNGALDFVESLISKGAKVYLTDNYGGTALNYACLTGQLKVADLLLSKGAKVNPEKGNTPLIIASTNGHFELVQMLIKKGAKIDSKNTNGQTALMQACNGRGNLGKDKVVKILLDSGTDFSIKDNNGETAFTLAQRTLKENPEIDEFKEIVKLLKKKGAK